jgi:hypothetical protein
MNKRLASALVAVASAAAVMGAVPAASASTSAQPCAPYPPGQAFSSTALPTRASVTKGSNANVISVLARGANKTPCDGYIQALRYRSNPSVNQQVKRSDYRGVTVFVVRNVRARIEFYFVSYSTPYLQRSANIGVLTVS